MVHRDRYIRRQLFATSIQQLDRPEAETRLYSGLDRLFHIRVDFSCSGVRLTVHPLVEAAAFEAPAIAELESWNEAFGGVLVEGIGRDSAVIGGLADVHDFPDFGDKKIGAEG